MNVAARRTHQLVWVWCLAYTSVAPADARSRRRGEIRSHLWESERAAQPPRRVASAAVRGMLSDLLWACSGGLPRLARSFATPTPYVVLAPAFPIQAWIVSAVTVGATAHLGETVGLFGGVVMLAVAGLVWLLRR